ncbi:MAG: hypothetical protein HRU15_04175 [Planctomycetes bacterium]|nr:hypothetical protein [Planctomycetota bacterium]
MQKIMDACPTAFVSTRMNCFDAISYPYGWGVSKDDYNTPDLSEPKKLIGELKEMGVPILNMSIGNPYFNPHYGRPYDSPIIGMDPPKENPLEGVHRFMGITREIQASCPDLPVISSGITWLRQFMPQVMSAFLKSGGAAMVGQGRGAFAYPDSPKDIMETGGMLRKKECITCSMCTQIMRSADETGCVVRDAKMYKDSMKRARAAALAQ